ncbi:MAG: Hsp70 family protein [Alphaproteobacteria bacterium]|nr:Hsp70 family protein [Alphaproteobacteria bacterium]
MTSAIGIDFGTTNTVVALVDAAGRVATVRFSTEGTSEGGCRSVLAIGVDEDDPRASLLIDIGPWAIQRYLAGPEECRLIQSPKSHLGSRAFQETRIFGRTVRLEQLVGWFLSALLERGRLEGGAAVVEPGAFRVAAGRPVTFWGTKPDDALAMARLRAGYAMTDITDPRFVYEPVGASFYAASQLTRDATVLVADLGGGTTDYSVIRYGIRDDGSLTITPLAHRGIGIGGDRFDFRIVQKAVAPMLGKGTTYRSFGGQFDIPVAYFNRVGNWHEFTFLRTPEVLRDLKLIARNAEAPERVDRLVRLVDGNLGFHLNQRIAEAKAALSSTEAVILSLDDLGVDLTVSLERSAFESWIAEDLAALSGVLDATLAEAEATAGGEVEIDVAFLTGGSSLVPAVRRLFEARLGANRIQAGEEFQSVAKGLALIAALPDASAWTIDGRA